MQWGAVHLAPSTTHRPFTVPFELFSSPLPLPLPIGIPPLLSPTLSPTPVRADRGGDDGGMFRSQRGIAPELVNRYRQSSVDESYLDVDLSMFDDMLFDGGDIGAHLVGETPTHREVDGAGYRLISGAVSTMEDGPELGTATPARPPVRSIESLRLAGMGTPQTGMGGSVVAQPGSRMAHRRAWSFVGKQTRVR